MKIMAQYKGLKIIVASIVVFMHFGIECTQYHAATGYYNQEDASIEALLREGASTLTTRAPLNQKKPVLNMTEISSLSAALSSTATTAGSDALQLLSNQAKSQPNALKAFFAICTALTTPDPNNNNAMPISVATPAVIFALSTGTISLLSDSYNYTLLHFASLFSLTGGAIDSTVDNKQLAATIITAILSNLTEAQAYKALMQKDKWNNTPLHYAVLSDGEGQAAVINALMSRLSSTNILSLISQQNMWGYTPLHYVATFAPNAKEMVALLCPSTIKPDDKLQALGMTDQWQATPLSYAALYKSSVFFKTLTIFFE